MNIRAYTKMLALFVICFVIFLTSSMILTLTTDELEDQAQVYDDDHGSSITPSITALYTNFLISFQIIFFILAVGIGMACLLIFLRGDITYEKFE